MSETQKTAIALSIALLIPLSILDVIWFDCVADVRSKIGITVVILLIVLLIVVMSSITSELE